ncbi:hypothetical protein PMAYCL1PPCAC_04113, partial [Pristionchus mayeri]
TPATPRIESVPLSNYMIVSKESLTSLLLECPKCEQGQCHLSFHMVGLAASCTRECNRCDFTATWHSSPVLKTSKASNKEKLPKINVDFVSGAILSAVGGTKLRLLLMMSGVTPLSTTSFHRLKKFYVSPAVDELFFKKQGELIDELRKRVAKGEKIHICGDGSFDSRGYSAAYCRYFLLNAETGEAIKRAYTPTLGTRKDDREPRDYGEEKKNCSRRTKGKQGEGVDSNLEEEAPENDDEGEDDA